MPNPLENKLLLYYLAGTGAAIGGKGSVAESLGGMTQQQIQTESFQKLLRTLLAGGGKFSMDKGSMDLKAPISAFRDTEYSIPGFEESYSKVADTGNLPEYLSPSASPLDVSGADLAGLTPESISQALRLKFMEEELGRRRISDLARMGYRGEELGIRKEGLDIERARAETDRLYKEALTEKARQSKLESLDQHFIGGLTLRQYNALTPGDKEYTLAKERARVLGDTEFMSKREWEETEPTERQRFLKGLEDEPGLIEVERKLAEARLAESKLEPTPVNWTTATKELNKRFGKLDPTGMWAVTPELQTTHRKAQELLVDFKDAGMDPLRAVNKAETQARKWKDRIEENYLVKITEAQDEREIEWIKGEFYRQFKYLPSVRK